MLTLKRDDRDKIIKQCVKEFPNEACGILAGPPSRSPVCRAGLNLPYSNTALRRVTKVYEMTNADKSAATFFMDAKEQLKVMREIRNSGLEMAGIYHSHAASGAYPSNHDVEMAFYPETSYVIISLIDKNKPDIKSFKINEGRITEEEIKVV